jgi:tetratricopeptide (TPR) repeat protein
MQPNAFDRLAELRASGQHEEVLRESQKLLAETSDPDMQASLLIDGIGACLNLGKLNEARRLLTQLQRLDVSDLEGRLNAAFCEPCLLVQESRLEEGAAAFAAILRKHRDTFARPQFRYLYEDIQCRRGLALAELGRYTEALQILKEAVSFSFDDAVYELKMHYWLGVCLEEIKAIDQAKEEFFRIIAAGLKNEIEAHARYRLSVIYFTEGGFAQAREQLETLLQEFSTNDTFKHKDVYRGLSQICERLGDSAAARHYADLERAAPR